MPTKQKIYNTVFVKRKNNAIKAQVQNFIFCLKLASVSEFLISSGEGQPVLNARARTKVL